jgi:hypothetical protein
MCSNSENINESGNITKKLFVWEKLFIYAVYYNILKHNSGGRNKGRVINVKIKSLKPFK